MSVISSGPGAALKNEKAGTRRWMAPPLVAGLLSLLLFVSCLSSTVTYGGDCGELISASWRLGIAHPTGYSLYCLAAKCFALLLPFGEVAWRYNLFSAVCGALAVGLVAATLCLLLSAPDSSLEAGGVSASRSTAPVWVAACGGALLLAGFRYYWSQSVLAEVYATAGLLLASLMYCAVSWRRSGDLRWLYTLALVFGLTLNAHLSCVYLAPGLALYALWPERVRLSGRWARTLSRLFLIFLAGYSLAVYLPLRSSVFPAPVGERWAPMDWTHPANAHNFVAHISARQYRIWLIKDAKVSLAGHEVTVPAWVQEPAATRAKLTDLAWKCALQLFWCFPFWFVGIWDTWRHDRPLFLMLALTTGLNIGMQIHYTVGDLSNFFYPAYMSMAIWLGMGIAAVMRCWGPRVVGALVVSVLFLQVNVFYSSMSLRGSTTARDMAVERAGTIEKLGPRVSAFVPSDDALWSLWYAHFVLGRAPEVNTPWGPVRTRALKTGTLWRMVAESKKQGPVVLSQFDEGTDRRFPLILAMPDSALLLASNRELPPPAEILSGAETMERRGSPRFGVVKAVWRTPRTDEGEPLAKRSDAATLEVTFRPSAAMLNPIRSSRAERSFFGGWIEVLLAEEGKLKSPAPGQREMHSPGVAAPPLTAWREDRRLVLPLSAANAAHAGLFRTSVSINMKMDARLRRHDFWTRIVRERGDTTTPWQHGGYIRIADQ